jgi:hypothetical protein
LDMRDLKTPEDSAFTHAVKNLGTGAMGEDAQGPLKAAKELHRVLKPGRACIFTT